MIFIKLLHDFNIFLLILLTHHSRPTLCFDIFEPANSLRVSLRSVSRIFSEFTQRIDFRWWLDQVKRQKTARLSRAVVSCIVWIILDPCGPKSGATGEQKIGSRNDFRNAENIEAKGSTGIADPHGWFCFQELAAAGGFATCSQLENRCHLNRYKQDIEQISTLRRALTKRHPIVSFQTTHLSAWCLLLSASQRHLLLTPTSPLSSVPHRPTVHVHIRAPCWES